MYLMVIKMKKGKKREDKTRRDQSVGGFCVIKLEFMQSAQSLSSRSLCLLHWPGLALNYSSDSCLL